MEGIKSRIKKKVKNSAFMLSLSIGSFIGFIISTWNWFAVGVDSFQWLSVVLGIGLIFEGKIQEVIAKKSISKLAIPKVITLAIGSIVLIGGIMTLPFLQMYLTEKLIGAIGVVNLIAIFVIGAEIFFID